MKWIAIAALLGAAAAAGATPANARVAGPRAEVIVGYESATLDDFGSRDDVSEAGAVYGLGVGYDLPLGKTVAIGVDLEASDNNVSWRETSATFNTDLRIGLGRDLYAGGRITAALTPALNVYAKAGYTNVRSKLDFTSPTFSEVRNADDGGVRGGAGVQFALGAKAYIGAEYRLSSYSFDLIRHQGVAALGFRF
jgi:outer membrane immunogenic protein